MIGLRGDLHRSDTPGAGPHHRGPRRSSRLSRLASFELAGRHTDAESTLHLALRANPVYGMRALAPLGSRSETSVTISR